MKILLNLIVLLSLLVSQLNVPGSIKAAASSAVDALTTTTSTNDDLASGLTIGTSNSHVNEQVPILSEQIAELAQQGQEEKPLRFKVKAEPAIYTSGSLISLRWKLKNMKPEDLANAEVVIHAPAGFTPTDPNAIYTPDGLVTIPLSGNRDVSEWNVAEGAELPFYFT